MKVNSITAIVGLIRQNNKTVGYKFVSMQYIKNEEICKRLNDNEYYLWKVGFAKEVTEAQMLNYFKTNGLDSVINATVKDGKIVGKGASLDRFIKSSVAPNVILTKIINNDGKTIAYKVVTGTGEIKNIGAKDLILFGLRATKNRADAIPVQNAAFNKKDDKPLSSYYSAYPETPFMVEKWFAGTVQKVKKAPLANKETVQQVKNEETTKLTDIFTREQLTELYEGKKAGLEFRVYANPALSAKQMRTLRNALADGVKPTDLRLIAKPEFKEDQMVSYANDLADGIDIRRYLNPSYSLEKIVKFGLASSLGINLDLLLDRQYTISEMDQIIAREKINLYNVYERKQYRV